MVSGHTATLSVLGTTANPVNGPISGLVTINGAGSGTAGTIAGVVGSTLNLTGGLVLQSGSPPVSPSARPTAPAGRRDRHQRPHQQPRRQRHSHDQLREPSIGTYDLFSYTGSTTSLDFNLNGVRIGEFRPVVPIAQRSRPDRFAGQRAAGQLDLARQRWAALRLGTR